MSFNYRFFVAAALLFSTLACNLASTEMSPTQTAISPSETQAFTATIAPSNTSVPTDTAPPSDTPEPATATLNPVLAQATQMMGTMFALMGPSAHLMGFVDLYANPTGTPLESWHDIPIMKEATAGQEFQSDIYSYKAAATLEQATAFYAKQASSLNWSCFPPASGSAGTGDKANHQSTFLCGPISIVIASFDKDPGQVLVVLNKAP